MMKEQTNQTTETTPPSQNEGATSQATDGLEPKEHPVMPADLVEAVILGHTDVLQQRLGLAEEDPNHVKVQIEGEASDPAPQQAAAKKQTLAFELQSATRFGCTILHLLVADKQHNDLAVKVFENDHTILRAQNKKSETPLHSAAKFGNVEVIQRLRACDPDLVKNVIRKTNDNGDTTLHIAVKYGQTKVVRELMEIDQEMVYKFNKEGLSPLHLAIANADNHSRYNETYMSIVSHPVNEKIDDVVQIMLDVDPAVAWTQFADGTFPIHVAARMGKPESVIHFMSNNWEQAWLPDQDGRNLFHIAAANNKTIVIWAASHALLDNLEAHGRRIEIINSIINAKDCEGNTPLHVAAMMGNKKAMFALKLVVADKADMFYLRRGAADETHRNNRGRTPFQVSAIDRLENFNSRQRQEVLNYIQKHGQVIGEVNEWYDLGKELTPQEIAERTQVIGLGSVLITTIAFAAAFTFPGGYNEDNGTPILGRRYMFRAFMLANALAFVLAFTSIFLLIKNYFWSGDDSDPEESINSAALLFLSAATSMVKAFGIGSYVMLAPVNLPIAIIILVLGMLFGSSNVISLFGPLSRRLSIWFPKREYFHYYGDNWREEFCDFFYDMASDLVTFVVRHSWPFLIIFGVAFLK